MKTSCLPVSFFKALQSGEMSLKDWARMAKSLGLDAIDLSAILIKNHTPVLLNQIRRDLEAAGIGVTMITTYPDFTHPDSRQRERELEYLRHDIAVAAQLGAKYLRILAGQAHPATGLEDGKTWAVEGFKRAAAVADQHGVVLLYENHSKPGAWDYVDFSLPTAIFLELYHRTRDTSIKVNFDTGNTLVYGDDPLPVLRQVMPDVETIHVADNAVRGKLSPVVIGTGIVPFKELFTFLKERGFDGWLCIEEGSNTGEPGVKAAVDFVKTTWEAIA
ncbi:MAG: sugar phosphate isomerase/epimerase family protein [bacterium]